MTGRRFVRCLKQDTEARHDFEALLLEQRNEIHKQLESSAGRKNTYRLQGKIAFLDDLNNLLEQLHSAKDDDQAT